MKKALWKILPIAIGIAFGFLFFHPPEFIRSLGTTGWFILPVFFILLISFLLPGLFFISQVFKDVELIPVERDLSRRDVRELAERFWRLGFKPAGDALEVKGQPVVILGFVREDIGVYGAVIHVGAGIGKTLVGFESFFEDTAYGLSTYHELSTATEPKEPGHFCQILKEKELEDLLMGHLQGLEYLHSFGLNTRPVSAEKFREDETDDQQTHREFLRKNWQRNLFSFIRRFVTRINPHRGPVQQQTQVAQYAQQFGRQAVQTLHSQARRAVIAKLGQQEQMPVIPVHSGYGITSFVMSLAIGIVEFAAIIFAGAIGIAGGGVVDEQSPLLIVVGSIVTLGGLGYLAGLGFGIAGAAQRHRKKLFAVLGIIFNALSIVLLAGLIGLGLLFTPR